MQVLWNIPSEPQGPQLSGCGQNAQMTMPAPYSSSPQASMSPMYEFRPFEYSPGAPMLMESAYGHMHRPSAFAASHAPMPSPLIMPHSGLWPSMLAGSPQQTYSTPMSSPGQLPAQWRVSNPSDITRTSAEIKHPRRILTHEERRNMCIRAEQNPDMRQHEIGGG